MTLFQPVLVSLGVENTMTRATYRIKSLLGLIISTIKVHPGREEKAAWEQEQEADCKLKAEGGNWELME